MYDDDVQSGLYSKSFYHPAPFPTRNITSPIMLLYGTHDSLVDIDIMLSQLPEHTVAKPIHKHEHIDILWGKEVDTLVIPEVLKRLKRLDEPEPEDDNRSASEEVDSDRLREVEE
jgi:lysosomal acid lipase/cholesteryl ester hydrolase